MDDINQPDRDSPLISYLRLLRAPNLFTAMADSAMGFFFVNAAWAWKDGKYESLLLAGYVILGLLVGVSTLLYAAGVVLNDVFDYKVDVLERPERPLPSGDISLGVARMVGWNLLSLGLMFSCGIAWLLANFRPARVDHAFANVAFIINLRPALVALCLAATIVAYNAFLKRTVLGPLAMGSCRMLNVLLGMSVLRQPWGPEHFLVAGAIGVYIAGVTWFARDEVGRSRRAQLVGAMLVMLAGVAMLGALPRFPGDPPRLIDRLDPSSWYLFVGLMGLFVAMRCAWAIAEPTPWRVRMVVTQSIMALIVLDASACYAARGGAWALAIICLLVPNWYLSRTIAST